MNKIERMAHVADPVANSEAPLTAAEGVFVRWYVDTRNVMQAYRQAYDVSPEMRQGMVYVNACHVLKRPHVMEAVRVAQDKAMAESIVSARDMIQDLFDIATADPNELTKGQTFNCRNCNGVDFKPQWRDARELAIAMDRYLTQPEKAPKGKGRLAMPDAGGGFGFVPRAEPNPACPHCFGDGLFHAAAPDTTRLSPKARKLYKGLKVKADGSIEVLMHDQMQARDMIIKMLGAYKTDGKGLQATTEPAPISATATPEDAQRAYLKLVQN